ncbi:MAG: chitobiase/beta-hexosaminidase C-terminal domain-containing protein, partial [Lachnospiraceae bacterium]|nr:chitobiase/beta-hexosaminidase C-terminal domain-containing protein [Lachnospiraceae bacterium]
GGKVLYAVIAIVLVAFVAGAIIIGQKISKAGSLEHQMELAAQYEESGNLTDAITALEAAYKIKPEASTLLRIAEHYLSLGRVNDSAYTLQEVTKGEFNAMDKEVAYKRLISIYLDSKSYEDVAKLLETCDNNAVLSAYRDYMVFEPEFNTAEGTYQDTVLLKLSSKGDGHIYYTLDGSTPTTGSNLFETPIFLEMGSYTVTAIYVNGYGVKSEPVSRKYLIDKEFVFEPTILTDSGDYDQATLIEADVPVLYTLYYTTDGSEPDKNSKRYVAPIPMPEGTTTFKFICYAPDGTQSPVGERTYTFALTANYTPAEAVARLVTSMHEKGYLIPEGDYKPGVVGEFKFMYSAIYPIEGRGTYYFVVEYHVETDGNWSNTGNVFAVNVNDLSVYKVNSTESGEYSLIDF